MHSRPVEITFTRHSWRNPSRVTAICPLHALLGTHHNSILSILTKEYPSPFPLPVGARVDDVVKGGPLWSPAVPHPHHLPVGARVDDVVKEGPLWSPPSGFLSRHEPIEFKNL